MKKKLILNIPIANMKKVIVMALLCIFVAVSHNANAQNFAWVKQMGGTGADRGQSVAVDASGNVYTSGIFSGAVDFDPG
ncbi:MAG: SBBP repeat-containing protein, partial [Chitinophagaceae bacterium]